MLKHFITSYLPHSYVNRFINTTPFLASDCIPHAGHMQCYRPFHCSTCKVCSVQTDCGLVSSSLLLGNIYQVCVAYPIHCTCTCSSTPLHSTCTSSHHCLGHTHFDYMTCIYVKQPFITTCTCTSAESDRHNTYSMQLHTCMYTCTYMYMYM